MNLYHCFIDLKDGAKALAFAAAVDNWMAFLKSEGGIEGWRLMRRKLNLAANSHRDFLLEIELRDLAQLDAAFSLVSRRSAEADRLYSLISPMIETVDYGLYRPYPDPERVERAALL
jgi:hypothetical protein